MTTLSSRTVEDPDKHVEALWACVKLINEALPDASDEPLARPTTVNGAIMDVNHAVLRTLLYTGRLQIANEAFARDQALLVAENHELTNLARAADEVMSQLEGAVDEDVLDRAIELRRQQGRSLLWTLLGPSDEVRHVTAEELVAAIRSGLIELIQSYNAAVIMKAV